jgi:hypothetical protein
LHGIVQPGEPRKGDDEEQVREPSF